MLWLHTTTNGVGHTKKRREDGTDDGTVLDGRCAAVMCPVVVLYGKLASENTQLQGCLYFAELGNAYNTLRNESAERT